MFIINPYIFSSAPTYTHATALEFDGTNEVLNSATNPSIVLTGAFSASIWFKSSSTKSYQALICRDSTGGGQRQFAIWLRGTTGYLQFVIWDSAGTATTVTGSTTGLNDGAWHHAAITYTGDTTTNGVKGYADGSLDGQGTSTNGGLDILSTSHPYSIGNYSSLTPSGTTFVVNGRLNSPAIWDGTVLSGTDISNLDSKTVTPYDLSADILPDIDNGTYGSQWSVPDFNGGDTWTSVNMESGDRYTDAP